MRRALSGSHERRWFLIAPLPATAVGIAVAAAYGVSWTPYLPNVVGLLLGIVLFHVVQRLPSDKLAAWAPGITSAAISATLLGPGIDGVHRWLSVGPLRLNVSAALAPWLLSGWCASQGSSRIRATVFILVTQVAHVVQPDAGQATALAAGLLPLLLSSSRIKPAEGLPLAVAVTLLAATAWLREDPLPAVDHVERILVLASMKGPAVLVAVMLTGLGLVLPFIADGQVRFPHATRFALLSYLLVSFMVTFVGNFPVPVFGAGAGPILGWYALLGVRAVTARRTVP